MKYMSAKLMPKEGMTLTEADRENAIMKLRVEFMKEYPDTAFEVIWPSYDFCEVKEEL